METQIHLIEKQPEIAGKIDELYQKKNKRFAGVILSTGGGKSFLAMDQIIKTINEHNQRTNFEPSDEDVVLSDCSILYFSPTHVVNGQFRTHMTKHIIAPEYLAMERHKLGEINQGNALEVMHKVYTKMGLELTEEKKKELEEKYSAIKEIKQEKSPEELILDVLQDELEVLNNSQNAKIVKRAFPNLYFKAYKNLEKVNDDDEIVDEIETEDVSDINKIRPELVIFDEAHRTGAKTWWPNLKNYIQRQHQDLRVLAITATPVRDVDSMNMMRELSGIEGMGYTTRERRNEEYLAADYPLLEAIRLGMVTPPEIVHFDMKLDETTEFRNMLKEYVTAFINRAKYDRSRRNSDTAYFNAAQKETEAKGKIEQALMLIMKSPFTDDIKETEIRIKGEKRDFFDQSSRDIGLVAKLHKFLGGKLKGDLSNYKANSDELEHIIDECFEFIQNYPWEEGKTWREVKAERVKRTIDEKLRSRGFEHGKALTFIDSMPSIGKKETKEEKRKRAQEYVAEQIRGIRETVGEIGGLEPIITIMHSAAFTPSENDNILEEFRKESKQFKIIGSVQKFNEGFHPDGVSSEFMIKEVSENKDKTREPRIVLLQQLRKSYSSKKRT